MYISLYIYIYTHICVHTFSLSLYIYIYVCTYVYTYIYIYMSSKLQPQTQAGFDFGPIIYIYIYIYIYVCIHIYLSLSIYIYIYMYIYIYIHVYIYIYIYIYTHTHTHIHVCLWRAGFPCFKHSIRLQGFRRGINDACQERLAVGLSSGRLVLQRCARRGARAAVHTAVVSLPRLSTRWATANLRTEILDFRGFDSSIIVILRDGILRHMGNFPESLSQAILS